MTLTKLSRKFHRMRSERRRADEERDLERRPETDNVIPAVSKNLTTDKQHKVSKRKLYKSPLEFLEISQEEASQSFSISSPPPEVLPEVNHLSSSESETSERRQSNASTLSRFSVIPRLYQPRGTKKTDCAGWKRLESTHVDHLEEGDHNNISLVTEDFSAIPALNDSALTFYTAKNSLKPAFERRRTSMVSSRVGEENKLRSRRQSIRSAPRRSILGRNEVILLSSESDSSPERLDPLYGAKNGGKTNLAATSQMFPGFFLRDAPAQPVANLMSKLKKSTVENWIVSSPFHIENKNQIGEGCSLTDSFRVDLHNHNKQQNELTDGILALSLVSTSRSSDATSKQFQYYKAKVSVERIPNSKSISSTLSERLDDYQTRNKVTSAGVHTILYPNLNDILENSESESNQNSEDTHFNSQATSKRYQEEKENTPLSSDLMPQSSEGTSKNYHNSDEIDHNSEATSKRLTENHQASSPIKRIYPNLPPDDVHLNCRALEEFYASKKVTDSGAAQNCSFAKSKAINEESDIVTENIQSLIATPIKKKSEMEPKLSSMFSSSKESSELSQIKHAIAALGESTMTNGVDENHSVKSQSTTFEGRLRLSLEEENSRTKDTRITIPEESQSLLVNKPNLPQTLSFASTSVIKMNPSSLTLNCPNSLLDSSRKCDDVRMRLLRSQYGLLASTRKADHFIASSSDDEEESGRIGRILVYTSDESESETPKKITIVPQSPLNTSDENKSSSAEETSAKGDPTFIPSSESEDESETREKRQSLPKGLFRRRVLGPVIYDSQLQSESDEEELTKEAEKMPGHSPFVTVRRGSRTPSNPISTSVPKKLHSNLPITTSALPATPNTVLLTSQDFPKSGLPFPDDICTPPASPFRPLNLIATPTENFTTPKIYLGKMTFLASLSFDEPTERCHPDAVKYVTKFKLFKEQLLIKLFKLFNEKAFESCLPNDLEIIWNPRLTKTAGVCIQRRVIHKKHEREERSSRIELSTKVLDSADRLRDTLIHEMCHAASWMISGYRDGHGPAWKSWAQKAMKQFPELPLIARCHSYPIRTKYTYKCTNCFYQIDRHSKSIDVDKKCCGRCRGRFELIVNGKLTKSGSGNSRTTPRTPNGGTPNKFALFVKENYKQCRTPGKTHSDAMKELASEFAKTKLTS